MAEDIQSGDIRHESKVREDGEIVVKAAPQETQATEVRPMRYVLGVGMGLVVAGLAVAYLAS